MHKLIQHLWFVSGQVGKHLLGSDAFQETDIIGISTPVPNGITKLQSF
jgi:thiamine pyrophosphate-dependent acetolactate synthase large subunit-like protein